MKIQNNAGTKNDLDISHKKSFTKISKLILTYKRANRSKPQLRSQQVKQQQ